jgi:hypothetical protein
MLGGLLLGLALGASAPRFEELDAQIRSAPIRPLEAFLGTTGIPLTAAWLLLAVPVFDFGLSLFDTVGVRAAPAWAGLLFLAQIAASLTGASLMELIRARLGLGTALGATLLMSALLLPAAYMGITHGPAWSWLAGFLPLGLGQASYRGVAPLSVPSPMIAVPGVVLVAALATAAWTTLGVQSRRSRADAERARSHRMGRRMPSVMGRWMTLSAVRDPEIRAVLALTLVGGFAMVTAARLLLGRSASSLAPLTAVLLIQIAAGAPLALSGALAQGRWLWRSIPASRARTGLSWWIAVAVMTAVISLPTLSPVAPLLRGADVPFVLGALAICAFIPSAVGRILPFRHHSLVRQLAVLLLQVCCFLAVFVALTLVGARIPPPSGPLLVVVGTLVATAATCVLAPWRES